MAKRAIESRLDRKFQQLSNGCECEVCRALAEAHCYAERLGRSAKMGDPLPQFPRITHIGVRPADCSHHIIRRAIKILRWDCENRMNVCTECHERIHSEGGFNDFVEAVVVGADKMDYLQKKRARNGKRI